jgi:hypothetical protein
METPTGRGPSRPTTTAAAARTRSRAPQKGAAIAARNLIVDLQEGGVPFLYSRPARTPEESEGEGPRWRRRERGGELASRRRKEGEEEKRHTPTTTESPPIPLGSLETVLRARDEATPHFPRPLPRPCAAAARTGSHMSHDIFFICSPTVAI